MLLSLATPAFIDEPFERRAKRRVAAQKLPGPFGTRERRGVGVILRAAPIGIVGHPAPPAPASETGSQRIGPFSPPASRSFVKAV